MCVVCSRSMCPSQVFGWEPLHPSSCGALQLQTLNSHVSITHMILKGFSNIQESVSQLLFLAFCLKEQLTVLMLDIYCV